MGLYPVIMCGGAGTRLWPASRPSRPKQFMPLSGNRSLFQDTALRVAPLALNGGRLIVVGGAAHRAAILDQLSELGLEAQVLLEPEARDSAAAMAAAAAWTYRADPEGINVFVASDHHIPDQEAFRLAAREAADAARSGQVVTLGVRPTEPSSAYGYIAAERADRLSPVKAFVEKPDAKTAERYIANGYLWNSGNFIVSAAILLEELEAQAPAVAIAATAALPPTTGGRDAVDPETLLPVFSNAPKISIDYAVMEKTSRASVLPVDFEWSDLGSWDAVAKTGEGDLGAFVFEDVENCMARASDGVVVAAIGVRNLAIIAERDAVLVCDMNRSQEVKKIVERLRAASPQHLDFPQPPVQGLQQGGSRFSDWLRLRALPLWSAVGQGLGGPFAQLLSLEGRVIAAPRRARVQARQIYVFAEAGRHGWSGCWRRVVDDGLSFLEGRYLRPDGLMRALLDETARPLDGTAMLYDQAFHILARASVQQAGLAGDHEAAAAAVRNALLAHAPADGGLVEQGPHPHQSNAHMHLLEACLAWEEAGGDKEWARLADRIVSLARSHFIDREGGFLREFFNADWSLAPGDDGRLIEPGHQFEWAWLLTRYARSRGAPEVIADARRLYAFGRQGVGPRRQVALDALNDNGSVRSRRARLWPQTEWMKAALILAETAQDSDRTALLEDAAAAQRAIWRYLTPEGLWRDKLLDDGQFIDEPAPASSLYHILGAQLQLQASAAQVGLDPAPFRLS
ncbi:AGE family epimerase/isomerase [Brevundimonas sp. VNH65]|uniref:AGE family epimerase/isomerase n=1 Tax=Brevundimonas sp. VNH65 TaxID=3400917 RepID=UPI003BFF95D4